MLLIKEVMSSDPALQGLSSAHKAYCDRNTPKGSGHAVNPNTQTLETIRYWVVADDNQPIGCIGLKIIGRAHSEIKTMHVLPQARGAGCGQRLVQIVLNESVRLGMTRISLETGAGDGFAASRRLYARVGFIPCDAFGDYVFDPFSVCMTQDLAST